MPGEPGTYSNRVTPLWAFLWLVAVLVIGITGSVALYNLELVNTQPAACLTGILIIGELLLYFIVMLVPTERVVPPGRTLLAVVVAMGGRALMAMGTAEVATLTGATVDFDQLWVQFYSSLWLAALLQIILIALYLWLIRSALEIGRPGPVSPRRTPVPVDHASAFRIPTPPADTDTKQRQEQLLSALMESPDAPVEETGAADRLLGEPLAEEADQPAQEPEAEALPHQPEQLPVSETADTGIPEAVQAVETETSEAVFQLPDARPDSPQMKMDLAEQTSVETEPGDSTDALPPVAAPLTEDEPVPSEQAAEAEPETSTTPQTDVAEGAAAAGLTASQDVALRTAVADFVETESVATALSAAGRIYALIGLPAAAPADAAPLDSLDDLFAALIAATDAIHAAEPESLVLMAGGGTLIAAASRDCASQVIIRGAAGQKLGQLSLLARRVRDAAADLRLGNECRPPAIDPCVLPIDQEQSRLLTGRAGQHIAAFTGRLGTVLTTASPADAPPVAAATERIHQAAGALAAAMHLGDVSRLLIDGGTGGLVIGCCNATTLLAVPAETTAKMGAANIAVTKLCDALRGEA